MNQIEVALKFAALHVLVSFALFTVALLLMHLRPLSAERRSWLLLATFVLALLLPFASFLPSWLDVARVHSAAAPTPIVLLPEEGARVDEAVYDAGHQPDMIYMEIPRSYGTLLVLAWMLGTLWQWMRLIESARQARRLRRSVQRNSVLEASLAHVLPRHIPILATVADGPMVVGLLRPHILIPQALIDRLPREALEDIVGHEVAHIRRGDLWWCTMLRAAAAVFWWNPFLHAMTARLELAREMACDARAALNSAADAGYADSLLTSAEILSQLDDRRDWLAVGMFGRRSALTQRIDGLLAEASSPEPPKRRAAMAFCALLLTACAGLAIAAVPRIELPDRGVAEPDARVVALLAAARAGESLQVRQLVQSGADIDARVLNEGTPLIQAVRSRNLDTVDMLLALGADPDRASLGEGNPLIVASRLGLQPAVERLVEAGADVNRMVTYDETPLINAARAGHLPTVRYLVQHGASVNLGVEADGWLGRWRTPLNQAQDPAVRAYLIQQGATAARR
ncbi:MAG TPA: M56 family metallopeptidase [Pseudoxanthomonas sp.]|nr:M56 family metallopeptidase [Pseudoxanthomonas sp.]